MWAKDSLKGEFFFLLSLSQQDCSSVYLPHRCAIATCTHRLGFIRTSCAQEKIQSSSLGTFWQGLRLLHFLTKNDLHSYSQRQLLSGWVKFQNNSLHPMSMLLSDTALPGMKIKQYLDNLKFSKKTLLTQKSKLAVQLLLGEMGITP